MRSRCDNMRNGDFCKLGTLEDGDSGRKNAGVFSFKNRGSWDERDGVGVREAEKSVVGL